MMIEKRRDMVGEIRRQCNRIFPDLAGPPGSGVRFLYSLLLILLLPLVVIRLMVRGRRNRGYWQRWGERFGFVSVMREPVIWIHAVSVGEVRAAAPLVRALRAQHPDRILITTMTPTGSLTVRQLFGNDVAHSYVPYDLPGAVQRFLDRTQPRLALIMETELWPNLFHACRARGIPLVVANARLSEKSARGYARFARLTRGTLESVTAIGAQAESDAQRLRTLGARNVTVTGSIKFELVVPADISERGTTLRATLGQRSVWVAASTREGEEDIVLDAFKRLRERFPNLLLVLVPRHPERFDAVARLCIAHGFTIERRSARHAAVAAQTDILLGDTLGELLLFYVAADVAFVGGSLKPLGGQNLLESLAVGTPVVFGPHMFNFTDISRLSLECGAARQVTDAGSLADAVAGWLADDGARRAAGAAGQRMVEENRGALEKTLALVDRVLKD
jgi:3-deoxy-D-manno-octulosonic-acid transferase